MPSSPAGATNASTRSGGAFLGRTAYSLLSSPTSSSSSSSASRSGGDGGGGGAVFRIAKWWATQAVGERNLELSALRNKHSDLRRKFGRLVQEECIIQEEIHDIGVNLSILDSRVGGEINKQQICKLEVTHDMMARRLEYLYERSTAIDHETTLINDSLKKLGIKIGDLARANRKDSQEYKSREEAQIAVREGAELEARAGRFSHWPPAASLEAALAERIVSEIRDVKTQYDNFSKFKKLQEKKLTVETKRFHERKRSLEHSIDQLPPARRTRLREMAQNTFSSIFNDTSNSKCAKSDCVVCQAEIAVRAIVPCGHLCLCDSGCADALLAASLPDIPKCPVCRSDVASTMKIYY